MHGELANKFMRTFTAQMEALSKMRRGGEQVIKYVHVHEGGQAVIGSTINQGVGGKQENDGHSQGAGTPEASATLPGPDPARDGVPIPGDAERAVSYARRENPGAPKGNKNAWKHGPRFGEFTRLRALARDLRRELEEL